MRAPLQPPARHVVTPPVIKVDWLLHFAHGASKSSAGVFCNAQCLILWVIASPDLNGERKDWTQPQVFSPANFLASKEKIYFHFDVSMEVCHQFSIGPWNIVQQVGNWKISRISGRYFESEFSSLFLYQRGHFKCFLHQRCKNAIH